MARTGCVLASTHLIDYSHMILSEMPYAAFSLAALWVVIESRRLIDDRRAAAFIALAVVLTFYIRSIGVALVVGAIVAQFLDGRTRRGLLLTGASFLLVLPWMLISGVYFDQLTHVNPYQTEQSTSVSVNSLLDRLGTNALAYGLGHLPNALIPFQHFSRESGWITKTVAIFLDILIAYFFVSRLRQGKQRVVGIYLGVYLGVVLFWPEVWGDIRFIVPAIPLFIYAVLCGMKELLSAAGQEKAGRWAFIALGILLFSSNALASWWKFPDDTSYHKAWQHYFAAATWVRANTHPDAIVACRKPYLLHVVSGRRTISYPWKEPKEILFAFEKQNVDFVVLDQISKSSQEYLAPTIRQNRKNFLAVQVYDRPQTMVLEFFPDSPKDSNNRIQRKLAALRKALGYAPSNKRLWRQLFSVGTMLQQRGSLDQALEVYEEVSLEMENNSILFHNLGLLYSARGRYDESAVAFEKAVAMSPERAAGHLGLAQAYEKLGKDTEAVAAARRSIAVNATAKAHRFLGRTERRAGSLEAAENAYRKALEIDAGDNQSWYGLASLLSERREFDEAAQILHDLVRKLEHQPKIRLYPGFSTVKL